MEKRCDERLSQCQASWTTKGMLSDDISGADREGIESVCVARSMQLEQNVSRIQPCCDSFTELPPALLILLDYFCGPAVPILFPMPNCPIEGHAQLKSKRSQESMRPLFFRPHSTPAGNQHRLPFPNQANTTKRRKKDYADSSLQIAVIASTESANDLTSGPSCGAGFVHG